MSDQATSVESPTSDGGEISNQQGERRLGFSAAIAADGIVRDLQPQSVLDAGSAVGSLIEALNERGVEAAGIASPTAPLERRYDLIACIDVLEDVPAAEAEEAIANLCKASDRLLLSTAPGERAAESWSAALASHGFLRDLDRDLSYVSPTAALYAKVEEPVAETVRRYERGWWRLRRDSERLRAELDSRDEEVMRLRDLLIARDAELGAARGKLAMIEEHSKRVSGLAARIPIPGAAWLIDGLMRLVQGRRG